MKEVSVMPSDFTITNSAVYGGTTTTTVGDGGAGTIDVTTTVHTALTD